jgi:hypothetical protein
LLDERTGQVRMEADGWTVVYDYFWRSPQPMPVHLIQQIGRRTFVARLTPQGLRVLGSVPETTVRDCQVHESLLMCVVEDGRTSIWRLSEA